MSMSDYPVGIVLGSGLGAFAETLENAFETPYDAIAGWPPSTAAGHAGKLVTGRAAGREVVVLSGRAHLYEGYSAKQTTYGIRELQRRGVRSVIITNASGGIHLNYQPGDLVLVSDHINLTGSNPLTGSNAGTQGPRFPDMTDAYCAEYRALAKQAAESLGIRLQEGIYAGLLGPSYETPAEIRYLRAIGADLVGMSTVHEAIAANHGGMKVLAISCVANMAAGILPGKIAHEQVMEAGTRVRETLIRLLNAIVPRLD
jgi:purine-nucleoside phosphorylase